MSRRAVIVDRDGTLIDFVRDAELGVVTPAFHPSHIRFLPTVIEACRFLQASDFVLAIATNQPQAAKGQLPREAIEHTNDALVRRLAAEGIDILAVETCLHHPDGGEAGAVDLIRECECRKPRPGLLLSLLSRFDLDPRESFFVGDTPTDVRAARAANMSAGLVMTVGRCELCPGRADPFQGVAPDVLGATLLDVARAIVQSPRAGPS